MYVQNITSADHPRRCLSLRFSDTPTRPHQQTTTAIPRKELRRIVAEMVG
jgi:hypothetical protein